MQQHTSECQKRNNRPFMRGFDWFNFDTGAYDMACLMQPTDNFVPKYNAGRARPISVDKGRVVRAVLEMEMKNLWKRQSAV